MNTCMRGAIGLVAAGICMVSGWGCASESTYCVGSGNTGKGELVGPLTTEVIANGYDFKKGATYYIDEPLYVETRMTNGLYLCRCGENATCLNLMSDGCEDVERRRRVVVASVRDYVDDDAILGPLLVYDGVVNFCDRVTIRSARLFRESSQVGQAGLIEAYRKMKRKKDWEAGGRAIALREKAKKAFSGVNVDPRGKVHVDKRFSDFVGLRVEKNTDKVVKAIAEGDVETLIGLWAGQDEKVRCVSEHQIKGTVDWLKRLNPRVELEWLGEEGSMPIYEIFYVSDDLNFKTRKHEMKSMWDSGLKEEGLEGVNEYVFCKGRRNQEKYNGEANSKSRRIENCKERIASEEMERGRINELIRRQEKDLLWIETTATQEVAKLQIRLMECCEKVKSDAEAELKNCRDMIAKFEKGEKQSRERESELFLCNFTEKNRNMIGNKREIESLKERIADREARQADDVKRRKQQIAAAIKERDEKTRKIEEQEKIIAQIEKEAAEVEAKRIEAERVPGAYTASWTNGFHKAQMAVASSDERVRVFRIEHNQKKITYEQLQEKVRNERRALNETLLKIVEED